MGLIETTDELMLDFDKLAKISPENKVIPVAVQNFDTKEVILVAYVNEEALKESIKQRKVNDFFTCKIGWGILYNQLWFKGLESGNTFTLHHIFVNCEQNSLVFQATPDKGNICHTSYNGVANNCYYRELDMETMKLINLNERKDK